jgi:hypothetical protein
MTRLVCLAAIVLLAGCSARGQFQVGSGTFAPGTSVSSSTSGLSVQAGSGSSTLTTLIAIGILAAAAAEDEAMRSGMGPFYVPPGGLSGRAPAMDESR